MPSEARNRPQAVRAGELADPTQVISSPQALSASEVKSVTATCPAGTQVINGGPDGGSGNVKTVDSFQNGNGWLSPL